MGKSRRSRDAVSNFLMVVALVVIWMLFAPVKFGGQVSYVLVDGISMLPNFHTGDLVLIRKEPAYQVGDVVTYHDPLMNADIIHRIIGQQGTHFVIQGDNNAWVDAYQPTSAEILGKLWLHLPKFGAAIQFIRTPLNMALAASLLGGFFMVTTITHKPNKNKKSKNIAGNLAGFELLLYLFGLLALGFLVLAIFALSRPAMIKAENIPYKQIGIFAYSAAGTSTVYDTGAAVSGEPVFTKLTCKLNLSFAYTLQGAQLKNISGTQKIYVLLQDQQSGWQRTIPLTADTKFTGNTSTSQTTLDLCQMAALVNSVEKATGVRLDSYTLAIFARVSVGGKVSGQAFTGTFEPRLVFGFDGLHLYLSGNSSQTNPLQTEKPGSSPNSKMVENIFPLFGLKPTVAKIRLIALIGLGSTLVGLLALALTYFITSKRSQDTAIRIKYGSLMIDANDVDLETRSPIIDVVSIENLARLAERQNTLITHLSRAAEHIYLVQSGDTIYRYGFGKGQPNPVPAGDQNARGDPNVADGTVETDPGDFGQSPSGATVSGSVASAAQVETETGQQESVQITRNFVHINRQTEEFHVEPLQGRMADEKTTPSFHVSDQFWNVLKPLLPKQHNTHHFGCHWLDVSDRKCADAIFYVLRTGCKWEALNQMDFCPASTAYGRFEKWVKADVFMKLWKAGGGQFDELKDVKGFASSGNMPASEG